MIIFIQTLLMILTFGQFSLYDITYNDLTLDTPIEELNNHTLKEVFEDSEIIKQGYTSVNANTDNVIFQTAFTSSVGHMFYWRITHSGMNSNLRNTLYFYGGTPEAQNTSTNNLIDGGTYSGVYTTTQNNNNVGWWIHTPDIIVGFIDFKVYDLTTLGISSLTVSQIDSYFNQYQDLLLNGSVHEYTYTQNEVTLTDFTIILLSASIWYAVLRIFKEVY